MRMRLAWLLPLTILAFSLVVAIGCESDEDDDFFFGGTDPFVENFYIGHVPIKTGAVHNIPLAHVDSLRFEVTRPVTPESLGTTLNFSIRIQNVDNGTTTLLSDSVLDENGQLVWLDDTNRRLEYRMTHNMSFVYSGGQRYTLGKPGDRFKVRIDFLVGRSADGKTFAFTGDEFTVVWTESAAGPV